MTTSLSGHPHLSSSVALLLFLLPLQGGLELPSAAPEISSYIPTAVIILPMCFLYGCSCSAAINLVLVLLAGFNIFRVFMMTQGSL